MLREGLGMREGQVIADLRVIYAMYDLQAVITALESENLTLALTKLESYAKTISNSDLERWAKAERTGYSNEIIENVPDYRLARVTWLDENNCEVIVPNPGSEENRKMIDFFWFFGGVQKIEDDSEFIYFFPLPEALKKLSIFFSQIAGSHIRLKNAIYTPQFIRSMLKSIRSEAILKLQEALSTTSSFDTPVPDLSWILDSDLRDILESRWKEATTTFNANAPLATVILLGSILEGLLLSKIKQNPRIANIASTAPKDRAGSVLPFSDWKLTSMIDVAFEVQWISKGLNDFAHILRDYRNLVHPNHQQQWSYAPDNTLCRFSWTVVKESMTELSL
jgi:hypothetical protein